MASSVTLARRAKKVRDGEQWRWLITHIAVHGMPLDRVLRGRLFDGHQEFPHYWPRPMKPAWKGEPCRYCHTAVAPAAPYAWDRLRTELVHWVCDRCVAFWNAFP